MSLPGDELVPQPRLENTRAITVQAPASTIWPWLVQMGQGQRRSRHIADFPKKTRTEKEGRNYAIAK